VEYFSKSHTLAECDYNIYKKESVVIILIQEDRRPDCNQDLHLQLLQMAHNNLVYLILEYLLHQPQARLSEYVLDFDYIILCCPGMLNAKADSVTQRPENEPEGGDKWLNNMELVSLKLQNLPEQLHLLVDSPPIQGCHTVPDIIVKVQCTITFPDTVIPTIQEADNVQDITVFKPTEQKDCLHYEVKVVHTGFWEVKLKINAAV